MKTVHDVLTEIVAKNSNSDAENALDLLIQLAAAFREHSVCKTHIFWTRLLAFGEYDGFNTVIRLINSAYEPDQQQRYTQIQICHQLLTIRSLIHSIVNPKETLPQLNTILEFKPLSIDLKKINKLSPKEKEISFRLLENQELCLQLDLIMRIIACKIICTDDPTNNKQLQEFQEKYKNLYTINYEEECKLHQAHIEIIRINQKYNRIVVLPLGNKVPDKEGDNEYKLRATTLYLILDQGSKLIKVHPAIGNSVNFPLSKFNGMLPSTIENPITELEIIKNIASLLPGSIQEYTGQTKKIEHTSSFFRTGSIEEQAEKITISFQRDYPVTKLESSNYEPVKKNISGAIKFLDKKDTPSLSSKELQEKVKPSPTIRNLMK